MTPAMGQNPCPPDAMETEPEAPAGRAATLVNAKTPASALAKGYPLACEGSINNNDTIHQCAGRRASENPLVSSKRSENTDATAALWHTAARPAMPVVASANPSKEATLLPSTANLESSEKENNDASSAAALAGRHDVTPSWQGKKIPPAATLVPEFRETNTEVSKSRQFSGKQGSVSENRVYDGTKATTTARSAGTSDPTTIGKKGSDLQQGKEGRSANLGSEVAPAASNGSITGKESQEVSTKSVPDHKPADNKPNRSVKSETPVQSPRLRQRTRVNRPRPWQMLT